MLSQHSNTALIEDGEFTQNKYMARVSNSNDSIAQT